MKQIETRCNICHKPLIRYKKSKHYFCSNKCKEVYNKINRFLKYEIYNCKECGKEFERQKSLNKDKEKLYCSKKCYHNDLRKRGKEKRKFVKCSNCDKEFEKFLVYVKRNRIHHYCSKKCYYEYRKKCVDYSSKYRSVALKIYEHKCGNCGWTNGIDDCLDVHHIDENRHNNNVENLIILCPTCHGILTRGWGELVNRKIKLLEYKKIKEKKFRLIRKHESIEKIKSRLNDIKNLDLNKFGIYAEMAKKWNISSSCSRVFIMKIRKKIEEGKTDDQIVGELIKYTAYKK